MGGGEEIKHYFEKKNRSKANFEYFPTDFFPKIYNFWTIFVRKNLRETFCLHFCDCVKFEWKCLKFVVFLSACKLYFVNYLMAFVKKQKNILNFFFVGKTTRPHFVQFVRMTVFFSCINISNGTALYQLDHFRVFVIRKLNCLEMCNRAYIAKHCFILIVKVDFCFNA